MLQAMALTTKVLQRLERSAERLRSKKVCSLPSNITVKMHVAWSTRSGPCLHEGWIMKVCWLRR